MKLSVVIGANSSPVVLESCLKALAPQAAGIEVLVCESRPSPAELQSRFPWARFTEVPGALVPQLWSKGIEQSAGSIVALTISSMIPAENWIAKIEEYHVKYGVVAGAIDPGRSLRASDWAEYFCRYSPDMLPFDSHVCQKIPGDNSSYKRDLLEGTRELFRDGFWEPVVNGQLQRDGVELWHVPDVVVRQGRSSGIRAFARQRMFHGRAHGTRHSARFSSTRNLLGVLGAPLVPLLLTLRIFREVVFKKRFVGRAVAALPLILWFNILWGAGEAIGHIDALRKK